MQHKDAHGVYYNVHAIMRTLYTYSVGSVLLVRKLGQYQSLDERNSNSAVPLFLYVYTEWLSKSRDIYKVYIGCSGIRDCLDEPPMRY